WSNHAPSVPSRCFGIGTGYNAPGAFAARIIDGNLSSTCSCFFSAPHEVERKRRWSCCFRRGTSSTMWPPPCGTCSPATLESRSPSPERCADGLEYLCRHRPEHDEGARVSGSRERGSPRGGRRRAGSGVLRDEL